MTAKNRAFPNMRPAHFCHVCFSKSKDSLQGFYCNVLFSDNKVQGKNIEEYSIDYINFQQAFSAKQIDYLTVSQDPEN